MVVALHWVDFDFLCHLQEHFVDIAVDANSSGADILGAHVGAGAGGGDSSASETTNDNLGAVPQVDMQTGVGIDSSSDDGLGCTTVRQVQPRAGVTLVASTPCASTGPAG